MIHNSLLITIKIIVAGSISYLYFNGTNFDIDLLNISIASVLSFISTKAVDFLTER